MNRQSKKIKELEAALAKERMLVQTLQKRLVHEAGLRQHAQSKAWRQESTIQHLREQRASLRKVNLQLENHLQDLWAVHDGETCPRVPCRGAVWRRREEAEAAAARLKSLKEERGLAQQKAKAARVDLQSIVRRRP